MKYLLASDLANCQENAKLSYYILFSNFMDKYSYVGVKLASVSLFRGGFAKKSL
jgi:hypothetical protein